MKKEQITKILKVTVVATVIMLVFEIIFSIPQVNTWFSQLVTNAGTWTYLVIWLIMFLQVTVLNIPAYVILSASASVGINTLSIAYIATVISAYILGCMLAYYLGRKFGAKAVKWCAGSEEDYNKWCTYLNSKGKLAYFLTVLFPFFPDDLLCIVCGATKINFAYFIVSNFIGRTIGLVTMLYTLQAIGTIGNGFPYMIIVWGVLLMVQIIILVVLKLKSNSSNQ